MGLDLPHEHDWVLDPEVVERSLALMGIKMNSTSEG